MLVEMIPSLAKEENVEEAKSTIQFVASYFRSLAKAYRKIQYRQLRDIMPNLSLTLTDQKAVVVLYLRSVRWDRGPLFLCKPEEKFYGVLAYEFEALWDRAIVPMGVE
jgi:hypothetical protein